MERVEFVPARRVLVSLLSGLERRTLLWLAARMPSRVSPDHLTLLGLFAMLMAGLSYACARWNPVGLVLVIAWLAVNWFGDSLDGTLARVRRTERPRYGFYVDHVIDAIGSLFLLAGLAVSGYMTPIVALGLLLAFYLLSIQVYLATYCLCEFRITFWRLGPTEIRVLLAIGNLFLLWQPRATLLGRSFLVFDIGAVVAIAGMIAIFVAAVAGNVASLYRAEPLES
jgi:phosphatidylglycerophosphate synthase